MLGFLAYLSFIMLGDTVMILFIVLYLYLYWYLFKENTYILIITNW